MFDQNIKTSQRIKKFQSHLLPRRKHFKEKKYQGYHYCPKCYLIHYQKAWRENKELVKILKQIPSIKKIICPVCQKLNNKTCRSSIVLKNVQNIYNLEQILELIKNIAQRHHQRDVLEQILVMNYVNNNIEICTSEDQFSLAIAKQIRQAFKGDLIIKWSHQDQGVRIYWYPPAVIQKK